MSNLLRWPTWIVILLFMTLSVITVSKLTDRKSEAVIKTEKEIIKNKINVDSKEWSKYPGLNLRTLVKESNKFTSSISTPITSSDEINQPIHQWLKDQENNFYTEMELYEDLLDLDFRAHLNIQLETEELSSNFYRLIFKSYQFTGGANGINKIKPFLINTETNLILQLDDVMELKAEEQDAIRSIIIKKLKEDEDNFTYVMNDLLEQALNALETLKWTLSKRYFTIHFDEYEIAAGAAGPIQIDIPIELVARYLNKDIAKQLKIVISQEDWQDKMPIKHEDELEDKVKEEEQIGLENLDPEGKYIALTFDDGPSSTVTPQILKTLKEYNAHATFFMLGIQVNYYPEIAKQVADDGHEIANHTVNHVDLTTIGNQRISIELANAREKIKNVTGQDPTLFRPPYGAYNQNVINIAFKNNESIILWSVDSLDWKNRNATTVNNTILKKVVPGSIVLMHDIYPSTADALPMLLNALNKEGYQFITVSQLLLLQGKTGLGPYYGN